MKVLFAILSISVFIFSCNSNKQKLLAEKKMADSIQRVQMLEREKYLADSLAAAARMEQAMTAFGELKFGMKRDTVVAIMKKSFGPGNSKTLGAYNYSFSPQFNDEGQLYKLQLETGSESSLQLESTVRAKVDNLKQIIGTKYGEPQKSFGYPDDFAFVETQVQWTNVWQFDTKTIKIGVAAETGGSRYKAICWIYDDPMRIKQISKGSELLKSKIQSAANDF